MSPGEVRAIERSRLQLEPEFDLPQPSEGSFWADRPWTGDFVGWNRELHKIQRTDQEGTPYNHYHSPRGALLAWMLEEESPGRTNLLTPEEVKNKVNFTSNADKRTDFHIRQDVGYSKTFDISEAIRKSN
jgi:hypothetical protein